MLYTNSNVMMTTALKRNCMTPYAALLHCVDNLIVDKAQRTCDGLLLTVEDLDSDDLGEISALYLEYDQRDPGDCFANSGIISNLLKVLKNDSLDNKEDLADSIRSSVFNEYQNRISDLLRERCLAVQADLHCENGQYYYDYEHRNYA
jgi:hypothetical protein